MSKFRVTAVDDTPMFSRDRPRNPFLVRDMDAISSFGSIMLRIHCFQSPKRITG